MDNIYYVYAHFTKDTNELFYIGVGTGNRLFSKGRNTYWKRIVDKHGYTAHVILEGFTDRKEAVKEEIILQILNKPRACLQYGDKLQSIQSIETRKKIGDANRGKKRSLETKSILSKQKLGKLNPMYNKEVSIESRAKMSAFQKGKTKSVDHINKITESNRRTRGRSVVNCRGVEFRSLREAADKYCPKNITGLCRALKKGLTAGKYEDGTKIYWKYSN